MMSTDNDSTTPWWSGLGNFNPRQFRVDAASLVRYLVRARAISNPTFPDEWTRKSWRLENLSDETESQVRLLRLARVCCEQISYHMVSIGGSGGIPGDRPDRTEIDEVVFHICDFTDVGKIDRAIANIGTTATYDWSGLAQWEELNEIRQGLDLLPEGDGAYEIKTEPVAQSSKVRLFSFGSRPQALIGESLVDEMSAPQHDVVKALLDAGIAGLSLSELNHQSGHSDARGILKRLCRGESHWQYVVDWPRTARHGYRIH
jgi:hypothetical protein